jgi:hypothetical protein
MPSDQLFTPEQKAKCVLWYHETKSPVEIGVKFRREWGRNAKAPSGKGIRTWYEKFIKTGTVLRKKTEGKKQVIAAYRLCSLNRIALGLF